MSWKTQQTGSQFVQQQAATYPTIQWSHDPGRAGFEIPLDKVGYALRRDLPGFKLGIHKTAEGGFDALFAERLTLAVICWGTRWEVKDADGKFVRGLLFKTYKEAEASGYKASSRTRAFVVPKEIVDAGYPVEPWQLTVHGTVSAALTSTGVSKDYKAPVAYLFNRNVISPAQAVSGNPDIPTFMFWMPIKAGPVERFTSKFTAMVSLPQLDLADSRLDEAGLEKLYVGNDLFEKCKELFPKLLKELEREPQAQSNGEGSGVATPSRSGFDPRPNIPIDPPKSQEDELEGLRQLYLKKVLGLWDAQPTALGMSYPVFSRVIGTATDVDISGGPGAISKLGVDELERVFGSMAELMKGQPSVTEDMLKFQE